MSAQVQVRNLHYSYPDGTPALRNVTVTAEPGESLAVIGANGAGKSTLLLHLNGCLLPSEGSVHIGEHPVNKQTLRQVRGMVGAVFQDPDDQLFMPTVFEDVAFGPVNLGLASEETKARTVHALEVVGAAHLSERSPHRLSGGEKRAVAIATVLAMSPEVLVLDEPSSGLDPQGRRELITLLQSLSHTKIIATHDLDLVLDICERCLVLDHGQVRAIGRVEDIFRDTKLLNECRLEPPLRMQACPVCGNPERHLAE